MEKISKKYRQIERENIKIHRLFVKKCAELKISYIAQKSSEKVAAALLLEQELERKEISRELHDEVAQMLAGVNFQLLVLEKEAANTNSKMRQKILETQKLVLDSVEVIHRFARQLRPMILDDLGLVPALRSFVKEFSRKQSFAIRMIVKGKSSQLSEEKKTALFRIAQESLVNVGKHANATRASLTVINRGGIIRVQVRDNGKSFGLKKIAHPTQNRGVGILGMKERMRIVGGSLEIFAKLGRGTMVEAKVSVKN